MPGFVDLVLVPLAVGAIGWGAVNWVGFPIVDAQRVRKEALILLRCHRHLSRDTVPEIAKEAHRELVRNAAWLEAVYSVANPLIRRYFDQRWDLVDAAKNKRGFANATANSPDEMKVLRHKIEKALGFPLTDTADRIERIESRIDGQDE